jgi:hypothetical protein
MDPGPFFYIYITIYCKHCLLYFIASKYLFPHYMSNPLFTANWWDWQPHCKLGQSSLVVLCAGSTLLLAPTPRTRLFSGAVNCSLAPLPKSASNILQKWFLSPTGRLNFGFITEGKLTVVLITPCSWGSQLVRQHRTIILPWMSLHHCVHHSFQIPPPPRCC